MKRTGDARDDVPAVTQRAFDLVARLTDDYCSTCLTEEYRVLARRLIAKLARKRPSPLFRGNAATWACGCVYAIGVVNFLFDPRQRPYVRARDLCAAFGIGATTGSAKAREIMKLFRMAQFDPRWCLSKNLVDNPLVQLREILTFPTRNGVRHVITTPPGLRRRIREVLRTLVPGTGLDGASLHCDSPGC
jgi:uncharacterized protein DUF6398